MAEEIVVRQQRPICVFADELVHLFSVTSWHAIGCFNDVGCRLYGTMLCGARQRYTFVSES